MSDKDLNYRLSADSSAMDRGFKSAEASARVFERELARLEAQQKRVHDAMDKVGKGMLAGGAAVAAGLGLAVKAAVDWESAWTGVAKVVSGTPEQLAALEQQLRGLTLVLPQSGQEIANVAAEAGALGIARQDIADFTKVMVEMGTATDLTSEEAADALARLMNIMKTSPQNVERLASTIVALGNAGASTESEITEMALRIAGAGNIIGLSETDVLAFASALSSVGIEAEAGGSAISTVFVKIESAVRAGGEQLDKFAAVAGMSADEFRQAYQNDAAAAIDTFIQGLGGIARTGGDVFKTLGGLEITEIRQRDALLRLSGAGDILTQSLQTSGQAWQDNSALAQEAERRYQTVEARMQIARNAITNLAIELGQVLLPIVGKAADTVSALVQVVADMPGPLKTVVVVLAALTAGLALAGGAALVAIPRIAAMKAALDTLAASEGRAAVAAVAAGRAIGTAGSLLAGPVGVALAAATVAFGIFATKQADAKRRAQELTDTLDKQTGAVTENTRVATFATLQEKGLADAAQLLGINLADVTDAALGNTDALERVNEVLREHGAFQKTTAADLKGMTDKEIEQGLAARKLKDAIGDQNGELANSKKQWQQQREALGGAEEKTKTLDPAVRNLGTALGLSGQDAQDAADAVKNLNTELDTLFTTLFGVEESQDATAVAARNMSEAVKQAKEAGDKHARSLEGNSKAALENRANVRDLTKTYFDQVQELAEHGASTDELTAKTEELRKEFIKQMDQAGFSKESIDKYAAAFDEIPTLVATTLQANTATAVSRLNYVHGLIKNMPPKKTIDVVMHLTGETNVSRIVANLAKGRAAGGPITGSGPKGVDSELIMAAPGEYMLSAADVDAMGGQDAVTQFRQSLHRGVPTFGQAPTAPVVNAVPGAVNVTVLLDGQAIEPRMVQVLSEHDRDVRRRVLAGVTR